jgi:hypothetical protein
MVTREDAPKPLPAAADIRRAAYLASFHGEEQAYTPGFSEITAFQPAARPLAQVPRGR